MKKQEFVLKISYSTYLKYSKVITKTVWRTPEMYLQILNSQIFIVLV